MFLTDDHLHTKFSFDSTADPQEICAYAVKRGLSEITLTDHMDIYSKEPYTYILDTPAWYEGLKQLKETWKGRLLVHIGIELGQPQIHPREAEAFLRDYPLDFIIGSIHNIEDDFDIFYCDYASMDCDAFYTHYIDWLLAMARDYDFDVCGHITYPSRYIREQTGTEPDMRKHYAQIEELFHVLIDRGRGIELNLSGIARGGGSPMPDAGLLALYRQCGGEIITIGSDAHVAEQAGTISLLGQEMLAAAGFRYFTWYEERKPHFEPLATGRG